VSFTPMTLVFGPTDFNVAQTVSVSSGAMSASTSISLRSDTGLSPKTIEIVVTE
jgi:hypothetical protein